MDLCINSTSAAVKWRRPDAGDGMGSNTLGDSGVVEHVVWKWALAGDVDANAEDGEAEEDVADGDDGDDAAAAAAAASCSARRIRSKITDFFGQSGTASS